MYSISHNNQNTLLEHKDTFKDLGVILDEKLTFRDHLHEKINKAYAMLGIIKRNFKYLTINSVVLLYKSMVRSHLGLECRIAAGGGRVSCLGLVLGL